MYAGYQLDQHRQAQAWLDEQRIEKRAEQILSDKDAIGELTETIYSNGREDSFHAALIDAMSGDNTMLSQLLYDAAKSKAEKEGVNSDDYDNAA